MQWQTLEEPRIKLTLACYPQDLALSKIPRDHLLWMQLASGKLQAWHPANIQTQNITKPVPKHILKLT